MILSSLGLGIWVAACQPSDRAVDRVPAEPTPTPAARQTETYAQPAIRFGVLMIDSAISVHERYRPLLDYLESQVGRRFELIALNQDNQFEAVQQHKLDFITNNPLAAVQLRRMYDLEFLVTTRRPQVGTQFGGVIIVHADSGIKTIADLHDKRAVCVDFQTAAGGCIFQIDHLRKQGFDPFTQFGSFVENKSQDNIVLAVLNGSVDVGFIRTGQLEKMLQDKTLESTDQIQIFQAAADDFPLIHTTDLYPEWPIAALAKTDPQLVQQVRQILLDIPPDHPALKAANLSGFVPAIDYKSVEDLIKPLKLKTWNIDDRTDTQ
jgi:two-component system, LuxR family, sensor histidine kinase TtrS